MQKIVLAVALFVPVAAFARPSIKPGQYHIKVSYDMQGAAYKMPPTEMDRCISSSEAGDPKQLMSAEKTCTASNMKVEGNKVSYDIACHNAAGTESGHAEVNLGGDSYSSTLTLELNNPRLGHVRAITYTSGTRTGDCK